MPSRRLRRAEVRPRSRALTGALVGATTLASVALLALIAWALTPAVPATTPWGAPTVLVVITAGALLVLVLAFAAVLESVSLLPLMQPSRIPSDITGDGHARITVVIPAHNEETTLPATLMALRAQTRAPDRIVVMADNCTDATGEIAREAGCAVLESDGNQAHKAGALNQALARLLPGFGPRDLVLVMDADTRLSSAFIETSALILERDPDVSAVGGVFTGDERSGLLAQLQRNEFARYARQLRSRRGRVFVLTGTATLFRPGALEAVALGRGDLLPGTRGKVYAESAITEDNELTLALKTIGAYVVSPFTCRVTTETMPTLATLWIQRLRWQRGALENLNDYGVLAATARYWLQQWGLTYGAIALPMSIVVLITAPLVAGQWALLPFWAVITAAFSLERGLSAWDTGWRGRLIAFSLVPEIAYSLVLQACFLRGLTGMMISQDMRWGHLDSRQAGAVSR